jgi:hypothetical protein
VHPWWRQGLMTEVRGLRRHLSASTSEVAVRQRSNLALLRISSTHAGVAIAVARLVADVRVQQPSTQQALPYETGFLQHAGRTDVLEITHRGDAEH